MSLICFHTLYLHGTPIYFQKSHCITIIPGPKNNVLLLLGFFCKWDHMLLKTSALTCSWFELCIAQHVWRVKVINCFPWAPSLIVHCSCSLITWVKVLPASARPRLTWLGTRAAKVCQQVKVQETVTNALLDWVKFKFLLVYHKTFPELRWLR